ncbi:MAG: MBL fold metallo-hydrolase [Alphaproteobacteria bacterium]|nr:MBL fold metallo-hydrolase [Alphaproteobacteria bacterium]MCL2890250.1 MBL fold metallo-hydrolase [Alphaproteobacteria bacterium]
MIPEFRILRMKPSNTNSVLIELDGRAVIIDPWGSAHDWLKLLDEYNLALHGVYCTHGHYDHISAIPKLFGGQGRAVASGEGGWHLHPDDLPIIKWSNPILFMQGYGQINLDKNPPKPIVAGMHEIFPGVNCEIIHAPGHSAGSVVFNFGTHLIVGDTVFQESYGRTDLPTGCDATMRKTLADLAARNFPDDTVVIHGHGPDTTIKYLRENNPFFK